MASLGIRAEQKAKIAINKPVLVQCDDFKNEYCHFPGVLFSKRLAGFRYHCQEHRLIVPLILNFVSLHRPGETVTKCAQPKCIPLSLLSTATVCGLCNNTLIQLCSGQLFVGFN